METGKWLEEIDEKGKPGCQNTPESMPHSSFHISFSKEIFYKGRDPTIDAGDKKIQMAKGTKK